MSRKELSNPSRDITGEACAWIAQLETGELTRADRAAFREWIQRSPQHTNEIKRLAALSADLNVLTEMADPIERAAAHYLPVLRRRKRRVPARSMLVAAGLATAAVVVATRGFLAGPAIELQQASFATAVGEQREIQLVDGTGILLNTDSELRVDYTREVRRVELVNGEAYFDVRPNAVRTFLVEANGRLVRAVGTEFAVKVLKSDFSVTVVEGRVELTGIDGASSRSDGVIGQVGQPETRGASVMVDAGQRFRLASAGAVAEVVVQSPREMQRALSWQEGIHDFSETPLEDVIREVNRYSPLKVEIADPALRSIEFGGIFRIGDMQPLLHALETSYGVNVQHLGANRVLLTRAADEDSMLQPNSVKR